VGTHRAALDALAPPPHHPQTSFNMKSSFPDVLHKALDLIGDLDVDVHSLVRDVESLHGIHSGAKSPGCTPRDNDDTHSSDIQSSSVMCHGEARHALVERAMLVVQSMREDLDWLLMDISAQQRDTIADEAHDAYGRPVEACDMVREVAAATAAAKRWRVRAENARQQALLAQELAVAKVVPLRLPRCMGICSSLHLACRCWMLATTLLWLKRLPRRRRSTSSRASCHLP
jgi:hypothetical protein